MRGDANWWRILPGLRNLCVFSSMHGQEYFLPIGEGTNGHTLSFVSWLLIRTELLAFKQL